MLGFGEVRPSTCVILNDFGTLYELVEVLALPFSWEVLLFPFILTVILTENLIQKLKRK